MKGELGLAVHRHHLPGPVQGPGLETDGLIPLEGGIEIVDPDEHGVYLEWHTP
jgi:hypothetical protein